MMSLELIIGPMFSGKTTELIRRCRRLKAVGKKVLIINHKNDNRNGTHSVSTHDGVKLTAKSVDMVTVHWFDTFKDDYDVIAIDEGQFFTGLRDVVVSLKKLGKAVIISGLQGDAEMNAWKYVGELVPLADDIIQVKALCVKCHAPAAFTRRLQPSSSQIDVGGKDKYMACCFKCYNT